MSAVWPRPHTHCILGSWTRPSWPCACCASTGLPRTRPLLETGGDLKQFPSQAQASAVSWLCVPVSWRSGVVSEGWGGGLCVVGSCGCFSLEDFYSLASRNTLTGGSFPAGGAWAALLLSEFFLLLLQNKEHFS